jgi:hypothetical protein
MKMMGCVDQGQRGTNEANTIENGGCGGDGGGNGG